MAIKLEEWKPQEPWQGPPLPEFLNIYWPWYAIEEEIPPVEEVIDFDLGLPIVAPQEIYPGTPITITCPVKSMCTSQQNIIVKCIIYEGSILPTHGTKITEKSSSAFSIAPGESFNVTIQHTAIEGTIDRRDVEVEVYIAGKVVKEDEWDDVYYVMVPPPVASLYGKVTDAISGKGIIGVLVTADLWQGYTDKNGNYAIAGIEPGTYTVTFSKGGYKEEVYEVTISEGNNKLGTELISILPPGFTLSVPTIRRITADGGHILISVTATNYGGTGLAVIKWGQGYDPSRPIFEYKGIIYNSWKSARLIKEITLGPDESKTVSFVFSPNAPGSYAVQVAVGDWEKPIPYNQFNYVEFGSSVGQVPAVRLIPITEVNRALADP